MVGCRIGGGMGPSPGSVRIFSNDIKEPGNRKKEYQDFTGAFGGISSANAMIKPITARTVT